jgi:hypothetical protein
MNETQLPSIERQAKPPVVEVDVLHDRRRPGRVAYGNPWLIRLLRRQFFHETPIPPTIAEPRGRIGEADHENSDALAPARGIFLGIILAAFLWGGIALGGRLLYRLIRLL